MSVLEELGGWSLPDALKLLSLRNADVEWRDIVLQLKKDYLGQGKEESYDEKACKETFDKIIASPHPEHFLRNKGKKYSQKELLKAWISFLERKISEERTRKRQLLLVKFREKLALFNKLFDDKCDFSLERIKELLEEARKEDSKRDSRKIEKGIARVLPKIEELDSLHISKPDTYGCLRLVIPVPQLCELDVDTSSSKQVSEQDTCSTGSSMSLRSASQSPQKNVVVQSPQRSIVSQNPQKTPIQSPQKPMATTPKQIRSSRLSPQKQTSSPQGEKNLLKSPLSSPGRFLSSSLSSEAASASCSLSDVNASFVGDIPVTSSSRMEDNEVAIHVKIEPETTQIEVSDPCISGTADESQMNVLDHIDKLETVVSTSSMDSPSKTQDISAVFSENSRTAEAFEVLTGTKSEFKEESSEKRQLRSSRKDSTTNLSSNTNTRLQKTQRSSSRRISLSVGDSNLETTDASQSTEEQIVTIKTEDTRVASLRSHVIEEKLTEESDDLLSRRRSDRLRGSETPAERSEVKVKGKKRKALNQSETSEEEAFLGVTKKRPRLNMDASKEVTDTVDSVSSRKSADHYEEGEKKTAKNEPLNGSVAKGEKAKSNIMDEKGPATSTSRRSSLRSAAQPTQEGSRKELANVDSDEEKTLGDIRDKQRSPRKRNVEPVRSKTKEEDSSKKRSVVFGEEDSKSVSDSHESVKGSAKKGRSSTRRSVAVASKSEMQSSKRQVSGKKHSKKKDMDDGSTEKKIFLMSAWRLVSSHRHAAIFAHPVSERDAQGYSVTVKKRMDLSTLKKNVETSEVRDLAEFKRRLLLMFANAVMFNSTGHDVNVYAKEMAKDTLTSLKDLEKDILYVRGGTHVTRRSAAFAAEEERRRNLSLGSVVTTPKTSIGKDISEDAGGMNSSVQKSSSRRSVSKLKN